MIKSRDSDSPRAYAPLEWELVINLASYIPRKNGELAIYAKRFQHDSNRYHEIMIDAAELAFALIQVNIQ